MNCIPNQLTTVTITFIKYSFVLLGLTFTLCVPWTSSQDNVNFQGGLEESLPSGFGPLTWIYDDAREGATNEIAVADLNGDGFEDIITASFLFPLEDRGVPILILLSDGQGGFVDGTSELISGPIPQTIHPREIILGDFNNDGRTDVFIADHGLDEPTNPGNQNTLLLSAAQNKLIDATGNLPQQSDFTHSAAAGDIDGDGDLDLYIGNQGNPPEFVPVQIWINDSDGNFTIGENLLPSQLITDSERAYTTSHFVDVNGDGAVDLVLGPNHSDNKVIILLNDGGGKFNSPVADAVPTFSSLGEASVAVDSQSADLNGDGKPDLLILFHSKTNARGRTIQVLMNNGDGTFRDESATRFSWVEHDVPWWVYFHLVDIDGDCDLDIMGEGTPGGDEFTHLFLNDGSGVFNRTLEGVPEPFEGGHPFGLIDINQDGALDIVLEAGNSFWYMLNTATACSNPSNFTVNAGLNGAWFNPANSGQGLFVDVEPSEQFMFISWFTYTDAASDNPNEQQWYTAQGNYSDNTATLDLFETLGGKFDDPQMVTTTKIGEVTLSFSSCGQGQMSYDLDEEELQGEFPLMRVIPGSGNVCEGLSGSTTQTVDINAGMDGAWFDPNTPGQGFFIDAHPDPEGGNFIFVSWFTYGDDTASGQRWLTAQGSFEGSIAEIDVFETTGGSFDDPQATSTTKVGTMSLDFTDCSNAQMTYSLPPNGAEGDMAITRVLPGGQALCEELAGAN